MPRLIRLSRDIQQIHSHEDDQESTYQGDGLSSIGSVESLEENGRSDDHRSGEEYVVDRVDAVGDAIRLVSLA